MSIDKITFKKVKGKSGKTWFIGLIPNAASQVYVTNNPSNTTGKGGGYGFGGATISFPCEDGTVFDAHGPWHGNSEGLYDDTGLDIRTLHLTRVEVSSDREFDDHFRAVMTGEIYYREIEPVMGDFYRGKRIGQAIADLHDKSVWVYSESEGGSSTSKIDPS